MSATAANVAQLRRMIAEPSTDTYSDADLQAWIEGYPAADANDLAPEDYGWIATYDLAAAASELWAEKAAAVAADFNFSADGASYSREQVYSQYMKMVRYHGARRRAGTIKIASAAAGKRADAWIANLPEPD